MPRKSRPRSSGNIRVYGKQRDDIDVDDMVAIVMEMGRQLQRQAQEEAGGVAPATTGFYLSADDLEDAVSLPTLPSKTTTPQQTFDAAEANVEALGKDGLGRTSREHGDELV